MPPLLWFPRRDADADKDAARLDTERDAAAPDDPAIRLDNLYSHAGDLEVELEGAARRTNAELTAGQIGAFNAILQEARALLPTSKALREDVKEIDSETRPMDVYHALHVTIVPTLHNALPDLLYRRHG